MSTFTSPCLRPRRFYVHLGYLVKIVASKHNVKHWRVEGETLALMRQAGFSFSLAMRGFFFFGLAVRSPPAPPPPSPPPSPGFLCPLAGRT